MLAAPFTSPMSTTKATTLKLQPPSWNMDDSFVWDYAHVETGLKLCNGMVGKFLSDIGSDSRLAERSTRSPNFSKFCRQQVSNFPLSLFSVLAIFSLCLGCNLSCKIKIKRQLNPYTIEIRTEKKHIPSP